MAKGIYSGNQKVADLPGIAEVWAPSPTTGDLVKVYPSVRQVSIPGFTAYSQSGSFRRLLEVWNLDFPTLGDADLIAERTGNSWVRFAVPVTCNYEVKEGHTNRPPGTVLPANQAIAPATGSQFSRVEHVGTYFTFTEAV